MPFNREIYFDHVRDSLFAGAMTQQQVEGQGFILAAWETYCAGDDRRWLAYFLATAYHETGNAMWPVEEYGRGKSMEYGEPDPETGEAYYGRGFVQLTWKSNYERADNELGLLGLGDDNSYSCVWHPELQLDPTIAARTGYLGMAEGWFRPPNNFLLYFNATDDDPFEARDIINGDMNTVPSWSNGVSIGHLVEGYHHKFLDALAAAWLDPEMTYGEMLAMSARIEEDRPVKDFELALSELIAMYRHRAKRDDVTAALSRQGDLVNEDDGWAEPGADNAGPEAETETPAEEDGDTPPAA